MKSLSMALLISMVLVACGGGGDDSSSGSGSSSNVVTECITVRTQQDPNVDFTSTIYTNTCDFEVNLVYRGLGSFPIGPETLPAGESTSFSSGKLEGFIACRPPSQGTNTGDLLNVNLVCR